MATLTERIEFDYKTALTGGERQDILTQASQELAILNTYLPQQLAADALKALVEEALKTVGPNQGAIMKYVMGKAAGAADGTTVNHLVGERLARGS